MTVPAGVGHTRFWRKGMSGVLAGEGIRGTLAAGLAAAALLLESGGARADGAFDAFRAAVFDEATVTLHARSYLFDERQPPGEADPAAWALGGWIGYRTGWIGDVLQVGAVGYTSQPLWAPADREGSQLLLPDQQGFAVLGQAYAALRYAGQTLTAYRQLVDQPEVNPHDTRMVPNTFEGVTLAGDLGPVTSFAGVLSAMKERDSDQFVNIAEVAGVAENELMYLGGLDVALAEDIRLRSSLYAVPDVLASSYSDARWTLALGDETGLTLSGQFMLQGGIGDELLTGPGFRPWLAGVQADFDYRGLTLTAGYTANGTDDSWKSPYGVWPGYTHMLIENFYRAGEQALLLGVRLDGHALGADGLAVIARGAVDTAIEAGQAERREYDLTAQYRFSALGPAWEWLSPLVLEARYGHVDSLNPDGSRDHTDELRLVADYDLQFTGGQFRP